MSRFRSSSVFDTGTPVNGGQIINLLSNAVRFSPPHTRIRVCTGVGGGAVRIHIVDTGAGTHALLVLTAAGAGVVADL